MLRGKWEIFQKEIINFHYMYMTYIATHHHNTTIPEVMKFTILVIINKYSVYLIFAQEKNRRFYCIIHKAIT